VFLLLCAGSCARLHHTASGAARPAAANRWRAAPHPGAVSEVSAVSASHFASAQHCFRMVSQAVLLHCMQPSDLIFHPLPSRYSQSTSAVCCRAQKKALIKFHPDRYQSASVAVQVIFAPCLPFVDRGALMLHALPSCMAASCEAVIWSDVWCCCQTSWCRPSVTSYWTPTSPVRWPVPGGGGGDLQDHWQGAADGPQASVHTLGAPPLVTLLAHYTSVQMATVPCSA
jgi:hypothetical protein